MERLAVLKKSDLFGNLDEEELRLVEAIAQSEQVEAGTVICKQGRAGEKIYVVEDGAVGILLETGFNSDKQVQAASAFESCAWSAMVEPFIITATVKANERTTLLSFRGEDLRELCQSNPEMGNKIYHAVARVVARRLRLAYDQLLGMTCQE
jgi:CRP-like cAMP-binding protein